MKKLFTLLTALVMGVAVYAQRTMVYSTASDGYVNIRSTNSMNGRIIGEMYTGGDGIQQLPDPGQPKSGSSSPRRLRQHTPRPKRQVDHHRRDDQR